MNSPDMIVLAQKLSHANEVIRNAALKSSKSYLRSTTSRSEISYDEYIVLWKGLFYNMYAADKPLYQESVAETISLFIHKISTNSQKAVFFQAALDTLVREWKGIDKFRMDKFYMLYTRVLRQALVHLKRQNWDQNEMSAFIKIMEDSIICPSDNINSKPLGVKMHLADILLEELAKVGRNTLDHSVIIAFCYPFLKVLVLSQNQTYIQFVREKICNYLMRQSDVGLSDQEDLAPNELEIEDDEITEDITTSSELDPRAGGVDVYIAPLKPDYEKLSALLFALGSVKNVRSKNRKTIYHIVEQFLKLSYGDNPLKLNFETQKNENDVTEKFKIEENIKSQIEKMSFTKKYPKRRVVMRQKMILERDLKKVPKVPLSTKILSDVDVAIYIAVNDIAANVGLPEQLVDRPQNYEACVAQLDATIDENPSKESNGNINDNKKPPFLTKANKELLDAYLVQLYGTDDATLPVKNKAAKSTKKVKGIKLKTIVKKRKVKLNKKGAMIKEIESADQLDGDGTNSSVNTSPAKTKPKNKKRSIDDVGEEKPAKAIKIDESASPKDQRKKIRRANKMKKKNETFKMNKIPKVKQCKAKKTDSLSTIKKSKPTPSITLNKASIEPTTTTPIASKTQNCLNSLSDAPVIRPKKSKKNRNTPKASKLDLVINKTPNTNTKGKTLTINLRKNTEYSFQEYKRDLNASPGIPFSALKRPKISVLKKSPSGTKQRLKKNLKRLQVFRNIKY